MINVTNRTNVNMRLRTFKFALCHRHQSLVLFSCFISPRNRTVELDQAGPLHQPDHYNSLKTVKPAHFNDGNILPSYSLTQSLTTVWHQKLFGAGSGNRTRIFSLEGCCSTIELYPHTTTNSPSMNGGGGWIRTNVAYATDLQSAPFNHSGTPPLHRQSCAIRHHYNQILTTYSIKLAARRLCRLLSYLSTE